MRWEFTETEWDEQVTLALRKAKPISLRIAAVVWASFLSAMVVLWLFMPSDLSVDISRFKGQIVPMEKVNLGEKNMTIAAPFDAALEWGSDAFMVYGRNGVVILRPEGTPDIYLRAEKMQKSQFYSYKGQVGENLKLKAVINENFIVSLFVFSLFVWAFESFRRTRRIMQRQGLVLAD